MGTFIKLTRTADTTGGEIWISEYQIIFMEEDEKHSQTYLHTSNGEIKVTENVKEILTLFAK